MSPTPRKPRETTARSVVAAFRDRAEGKARRPGREDDIVARPPTREPRIDVPTLLESHGVKVKSCELDNRGLVEVVCDADDFDFDNPIYIVNPPLLVPDDGGEVAVVSEDEKGAPVTRRYREDPAEALLLLLADLKRGDA